MLCPTCNVDLLLSERLGIEIDYCPKCRGIWLDRGELEKLIERSSEDTRYFPTNDHHDQKYEYDDHKSSKHHGHSKRRESWISRMLDFD
ncbi:MAG: zf-TFIIB domain-containing protein [Desulfomonilaceae bacterium]